MASGFEKTLRGCASVLKTKSEKGRTLSWLRRRKRYFRVSARKKLGIELFFSGGLPVTSRSPV